MAATGTGDLQTGLQLQDHDQHPIRRSSARRKTKGGGSLDSKKLKQPRRGMGVAKLERLRLQEMPETDQPGFPHPVLEMNASSAHAYAGFSHVLSTPNPVGFPGCYDHHRLLQNHEPDFFGLNSQPIAGNAVKCYSLHCNTCHKKKKVKGDRRFLGLDLGESQNIVNHDRHLGINHGNKVEVVAVHRKGSSRHGRDGDVMMEYDFFPSGNMESGGGGGGEAGMMMTRVAGFDASNCVDLSLRLSSY